MQTHTSLLSSSSTVFCRSRLRPVWNSSSPENKTHLAIYIQKTKTVFHWGGPGQDKHSAFSISFCLSECIFFLWLSTVPLPPLHTSFWSWCLRNNCNESCLQNYCASDCQSEQRAWKSRLEMQWKLWKFPTADWIFFPSPPGYEGANKFIRNSPIRIFFQLDVCHLYTSQVEQISNVLSLFSLLFRYRMHFKTISTIIPGRFTAETDILIFAFGYKCFLPFHFGLTPDACKPPRQFQTWVHPFITLCVPQNWSNLYWMMCTCGVVGIIFKS